MAENKNPWTKLSERMIYENPWIRLDEHKVINPSGGEGIYGKVSFKNKAIGILPIDNEGNTWLVGQYRYTLDQYSWEIPMGGVPMNESIHEGALRELKEETGLVAKSLTELCKIHTSNSVTDEEGTVFLATELLQDEPEFDDTEDITIKKVSFREALAMTMDSEITDSLSVAGILKYARLLEGNG